MMIQTYLHLKIIWTLIIYLLLVLAPTIFLLGQTLPIIMNIVRQNRTAGAIAGRALGLSTIGSFFGAVFTTLVLMHYFGVAFTVMVIFVLLMFMSMMLCQNQQSFYVIGSLALAATILMYVLNVTVENKLFVLTTNYANYQVLNHENSPLPKGSKILVINELFSSYSAEDNHAFEYIETIRKILYDDLKMNHADILVLGAGGFSLSQGDVRNNQYTYVDIDDQITKAVKPAYLEEIKEKVVFNDARQYLQTTDKKYDAIVVDVYSDIAAIPAHLLTYQFVQSIKDHLKTKGVVLFNIIARPQFDDVYSRRIDNTIRAVFGSCAVIPVKRWYETDNIIFACYNRSDRYDTTVYTDDLNTSTTDSYNW